MFISSELKKHLQKSVEHLTKKQQQQYEFNLEIIKKIDELYKKVKPTEIPNYQNIFKENK